MLLQNHSIQQVPPVSSTQAQFCQNNGRFKKPPKKKMKNETGHERIQLHHPHFAHFAPGANKHHILK
jgi:hypothetical protein